MCRMAMFVGDKDGRKYIEVLSAMVHLDKLNGGGGMGVALMEDGKSAVVTKSVGTTAQQCARLVVDRPLGVGAIWHTRAATVGDRHDQRCHPFYMSRKLQNGRTQELVLAHNGTMHDWYMISRILKFNCWNDSHLLTRLLLHDMSLATVVLKGGALLAARRTVNKNGTSTPWKYQCMRVSYSGDLIGFCDGGVASMKSAFDNVNDRELPYGKWISLRPGVRPPEMAPFRPDTDRWDSRLQRWVKADGTFTLDAWDEYLAERESTPRVKCLEVVSYTVGQAALRLELSEVSQSGKTGHELKMFLNGGLEVTLTGKKRTLSPIVDAFDKASSPAERNKLFEHWKAYYQQDLKRQAP